MLCEDHRLESCLFHAIGEELFPTVLRVTTGQNTPPSRMQHGDKRAIPIGGLLLKLVSLFLRGPTIDCVGAPCGAIYVAMFGHSAESCREVRKVILNLIYAQRDDP